jgi:hypothetical protein
MTSMPFWNLMPWTTFGNWFSPFNRRHVFAAALTSLHLKRYLGEFDFRYNHRIAKDRRGGA